MKFGLHCFPMIRGKQECRKRAFRPVLLELDPLIATDEGVIPGLFDQGQQLAVLDPIPASLVHIRNVVTGEIKRYLLRHALIEDYPLQG